MTTMIERVAIAIGEKIAPALSGGAPVPLHDTARAAIEAMREPTHQMVNAAWSDYENSPNGVLVEESSVGHSPDDLSHDTAYEVWRAMIEAALTEQPGPENEIAKTTERAADFVYCGPMGRFPESGA